MKMNGMNSPRHLVVMGVSGSGKSTVAEALRDRTGWVFAEADDFHPAANIEKMENGTPLTDEDRGPWLEALTEWIQARERAGMSSVVTCSALKRSYRDQLRKGGRDVVFVHLHGEHSTLEQRLGGRSGHFMPASLLDSQLDTLEPLGDDESGYVFSIDLPPAQIVDEIFRRLAER